MNCTNCGATNAEEARFCEQCGKALTPPPQVAPSAASDDVAATHVRQHGREDTREAAGRVLSAAPPGVFFMATLVEWVSRGDFFRRFVSLFLRGAAILTALVGALASITIAVIGFRDVSGVGDVLAVLLVLAVMVVAVYMYAHLFLIRARTVASLPESPYSAIPVASVMIKLFGEQLAVASIVTGVVGFVVALFAGGYDPYAMGGLGYGGNPLASLFAGGGSFLGGLGGLLGGIIGAFVSLIVAYMLAEAVSVLVDMARDVKVMRESAK